MLILLCLVSFVRCGILFRLSFGVGVCVTFGNLYVFSPSLLAKSAAMCSSSFMNSSAIEQSSSTFSFCGNGPSLEISEIDSLPKSFRVGLNSSLVSPMCLVGERRRVH